MKLLLHQMPQDTKGIYKINGVQGRMPDRALFLAPDAAVAWFSHGLDQVVTVSDMLRTAEVSLAAVRAKRGAQPPAYSAHNFGIAFDTDIQTTMKAMGCKDKTQMDQVLETYGFFCHRRDHANLSESWHYTWLSPGAIISPKVKTIVNYTEAEIIKRYGSQMVLDNKAIQQALQTLKMYSGAIDGLLGPISKEAIKVFQRAWDLTPSGIATAETQRTLAFVAADRVLAG